MSDLANVLPSLAGAALAIVALTASHIAVRRQNSFKTKAAKRAVAEPMTDAHAYAAQGSLHVSIPVSQIKHFGGSRTLFLRKRKADKVP